jgi:serine/threonine protein kinase
MSASCKDLIRQMFALNPHQRISIEGIKQHPWFTQAMPEALEVRLLLRFLLTA